MKTTLLLLFSIVASALAQDRINVLLWGSDTNSDTVGIPAQWPRAASPATNAVAPAGWTNMTTADYSAHRAAFQPAYDAWRATKDSAEKDKTTNAKQAMGALMDDFAAYEDAWKAGTNFNNATINTIVRKHNRALLKMRPMLREFYRGDE